MKKKILLLMGVFSIGFILHAQVGINTQNPQGLFHVDGKANNSSIPTAIEALDDIVVNADGNVGIGLTNPSVKLVIEDGATVTSPRPLLKIVDPNVGAGKVMTAMNANGEATWQNYQYMGKIGKVHGTDNLPAQNFPTGTNDPIKINAATDWSFTIPIDGYYAFDVRWWAQFEAKASLVIMNTATHFTLELDGIAFDQYEVYETINTIQQNSLTSYFALYYNATTADINKTITIKVRPGIAPTSNGQSLVFSPGIDWVISKINVKRMDI